MGNYLDQFQNKSLRQHEYTNMGVMATIVENKDVVDLHFIKFKVYSAWLTWMFVHLMLILSLKIS